MKLRDHVLYAIDDAQARKPDAALLHACIAIDGTAKRLFPNKPVRLRYIDCLRRYYWLMEAMIGVGINLEETRFANIRLPKLEQPDLAEIVYYIFRCSHAHADEVPEEFTLIASEGNFGSGWMLGNNQFHMPDRIVWALLAVTVFSNVNANEFTTGNYYLSLGNERFPVSEWWGREDDFRPIAERYNQVRVKLEKLERLTKVRADDPAASVYHLHIVQPYMGDHVPTEAHDATATEMPSTSAKRLRES